MNNRWLLPEGIEDLLPVQAEIVENMRRKLLDLFHVHGYELVIPPLIEYVDSLQVGTGNDLQLQTFKLIDQLTGRLMGVRADMTPQVARIDAHSLKREVPTRLCYMGTVLHTLPAGHGASRSPMQVGAELYGHSGLDSDVEVLALMLETLQSVGITDLYIDLGHVAIFRSLSQQAGLTSAQEADLFDMLQRKARPEMDEYLATLNLSTDLCAMLQALPVLNGGEEVLSQARSRLAGGGTAVLKAIDELEMIANMARRRMGAIEFHFDLAELRGYHYHTGAVFAAYATGQGQAIAQGGRYDQIGSAFGRARPATGFSTDLKTLLAVTQHPEVAVSAIFAPVSDDPGLYQAVSELRAQGERVVMGLLGQTGDAIAMGCDRMLVNHQDNWTVTRVEG